MKKFFIKRFWRKSTLSLLMVIIYLISIAYSSGVYALQNGANPNSITYWDGTDNYTSLDNLLAALVKDSDDFYHITEADQLHAAIKFQGGEKKYKLDNDLYLNENYENYENWGSSAPANIWHFNQGSSWDSKKMTPFTGTIDGCGYTIYGLYSNTTGHYNGLIGATIGTTVIKNLNVSHVYLNAANRAGVIVGIARGGSLAVEGCSVRNVYIKGGWDNVPAGGILGLSQATTVRINNSAVTDVKFTGLVAKNQSQYKYVPYAFGSFIGGIYENMQNTANTGSLAKVQAQKNIIENSYAVNVVNVTNNNSLEYVCGLFTESNQGSKWGYSITADNVYTDATTIPTNNKTTPKVKLLVSRDGQSAVSSTNENYPIKTITADSIKGNAAKVAMPTLNWSKWTTFENDYPYYIDEEEIIPDWVWDGKDEYTDLDALITDLGESDSDGYYHIKTANQLHAAIRFQGGGNKYKLDNDIYLNYKYENYLEWNIAPPANTWHFNTASNWDINKMSLFTGTIDGCGYTIYGLYSNTTGHYNGLIGATKDANIKNLNVSHVFLNGHGRAGVIVGCHRSGTLTIDACTVRNAFIKGNWENTPSGGIVGMSFGATVKISDSGVADVKFTSGVEKKYASQKHNPYAFGSFLGAIYTAMVATEDTGGLNKTQATKNVIENCYAVNVVNQTNDNAPVYICGLYYEGSAEKWGYCVTAKNIYTDATEITASNIVTPQVKLLVTTDGTNALSVDDEKYPIKTITADSIKGTPAKTVMDVFNWCKWKTVANDYPSPQGGHALSHNQTVPATCEQSGTEEYWLCLECNKKFSDSGAKNEIKAIVTIEAINHKNSEYLAEKEATCTEDGNNECWYCPDCKKYSLDEEFTAICEASVVIIPRTNHLEGKMHYTASPATCDEDGHIEYWHCTDCDKYYIDEACQNEVTRAQVITEPATGHRNPVYREATPAGDTCVNPGTIAHWECLDCNKYFEDETCTKELDFIDAPSDKHTPKKVSEKKATCYEAGRKEHYECTTCHRYFDDVACLKQVSLSNLNISSIKHSNAKYYSELSPSCTTIGLKKHWYCADCGTYFSKAKFTETNKIDYVSLVIAAHGHKTSEDSIIEYDSEKHWQLCDVCNTAINHEAHKISEPVSVYDGVEKRCKCLYGLQKFDYKSNGVNITADFGILDANVKLKVSKVLEGAVYENFMSTVGEKADDVEIFNISAKIGNLKVLPKEKVNIVLPVSKRYSANVEIYSIDENGNSEKLNADIKRTEEVANLSLYGFGTFAVVDLGVPYNNGGTPDTPATDDSDDENPSTDSNTETSDSDDENTTSDSNNGTVTPDNDNSVGDSDNSTGTKDEENISNDNNSETKVPSSGNSSNKNDKNNDNSNTIIIFIVVTVVAGFVLVTFGTVLLISKSKKKIKD